MLELGECAADAAKEDARLAALRLTAAIELGGWDDVAEAAQEAYLVVGRLAVLARAEAEA